MLSHCDTKKIELNLKVLKNNPRVVTLMKTIRRCNIDIDRLNELETSELLKCILIVSR